MIKRRGLPIHYITSDRVSAIDGIVGNLLRIDFARSGIPAASLFVNNHYTILSETCKAFVKNFFMKELKKSALFTPKNKQSVAFVADLQEKDLPGVGERGRSPGRKQAGITVDQKDPVSRREVDAGRKTGVVDQREFLSVVAERDVCRSHGRLCDGDRDEGKRSGGCGIRRAAGARYPPFHARRRAKGGGKGWRETRVSAPPSRKLGGLVTRKHSGGVFSQAVSPEARSTGRAAMPQPRTTMRRGQGRG